MRRALLAMALVGVCGLAGYASMQTDDTNSLDPPDATALALPTEPSAPTTDESIEILFERDAVVDSVLTCAIFRADGGKTVGLMTPAQLLVRLDDSTVVGINRTDAVNRCQHTLKRNGVVLTTSELRKVTRWDGKFMVPKGAKLRA